MARRKAARTRTPLSRERIVKAALELVDAQGLEALSMRRLGAALGIEAMSLYSHFRDKDELLDGVQEAILEGLAPGPRRGSWREQLTRAAQQFRGALAAHRRAMPLFATRPAFTPRAMRHVEPSLQLLKEAGLSDVETLYAFDALTTFIVGHALSQWGDVRHDTPEQYLVQQLAGLSRLPPEQFPTVAALLPGMSRFRFDDSFAFGLRCVFDGIEASLRL